MACALRTALRALAGFAYQAVQPFYNAMLPELLPPEEQGLLSGFGTAIGSSAGVLLVAPFFNGALPAFGQLSDSTTAVLRMIMPFTSHGARGSTFLPTGVLFVFFSLPLVFFAVIATPRRKARQSIGDAPFAK